MIIMIIISDQLRFMEGNTAYYLFEGLLYFSRRRYIDLP